MSVLRTFRRLVGHVLPHLPTSGGLHHAGELVGILRRQGEGADDARLTRRAPLVDQHDPAGPVRSVLDLKQSGVGACGWLAMAPSLGSSSSLIVVPIGPVRRPRCLLRPNIRLRRRVSMKFPRDCFHERGPSASPAGLPRP